MASQGPTACKGGTEHQPQSVLPGPTFFRVEMLPRPSSGRGVCERALCKSHSPSSTWDFHGSDPCITSGPLNTGQMSPGWEPGRPAQGLPEEKPAPLPSGTLDTEAAASWWTPLRGFVGLLSPRGGHPRRTSTVHRTAFSWPLSPSCQGQCHHRESPQP